MKYKNLSETILYYLCILNQIKINWPLDIVSKYFTNLSDLQKTQFSELESLYKYWNEKINVISRKDIDYLYFHHVLHSLAIAKFIDFKDGTKIIDLGTGGGFPGIPLAIMFPDCDFLLIDSINKKIKVVKEVSDAIKLKNVRAIHGRAEELKEKFDFVVTRAVAKVDTLLPWSRKILSKSHKNMYPNGLIALKGDIKSELELLPKYEYKEIIPITKFFNDPYFQEKFLLYIQG